MHSVTSVI